MYWCASSSKGDDELVQQKWLSILNHIVNIHEGHGDKFPSCLHGPLEERNWMKKGFKPYEETEKIVKSIYLIKDIKKLSPAIQTSALESFHSLECHFASKQVHYYYPQMEARLTLAALHFNENACRRQALTRDGNPQWKISFPKSRNGEPIATEIKTSPTFEYIDELMTSLMESREQNNTSVKARKSNSLLQKDIPIPIAQSTPRPEEKKKLYLHTKPDLIGCKVYC